MIRKSMLRWVAAVTTAAALLAPTAAYAGDMEVTVIGGPEADTSPVSLDDVKLEKEVEIDGYAKIKPSSFEYVDDFYTYIEGADDNTREVDLHRSGQDAEYAVLKMDITNLATAPKDFLDQAHVKVVYDDTYEYEGWTYQYNYNNRTKEQDWVRFYWNEGKNYDNWYYDLDSRVVAINNADRFTIDPMYAGHYAFGCTLPNSVVDSKAPLRMEIEVGGNEITYNIRK